MKVLSVIGTRPQYMKLDRDLKQVIVDTGQHYSDGLSNKSFFEQLNLPKPNHELGAKKFTTMVGKLLKVLKQEDPDIVQVFGDTRSTLAGAIAASELNIPIAHVEAGARCYNKSLVEERNRVIVDHLSTILFTPTLEATENLAKEGIYNGVYLVGNTMLDTFNDFCPLSVGKDHRSYSYLSIHRAETADSVVRLESIFEAIEDKGQFIFPCHPRTRKTIRRHKIQVPENVRIIDPVGYKDNIQLISDAEKVLTDSGGVQNEAYWMAVPCGILRTETEWNEQIKDGFAVLVGCDPVDIEMFLDQQFNRAAKRPHMPKFGAKSRIKEVLENL